MAAAATHEATSAVLVGSTAPREDSAARQIMFLGAIAEGAPLLDTNEFSNEEFLSALEVQLRCDIDVLSIGDLESFEDLEAE